MTGSTPRRSSPSPSRRRPPAPPPAPDVAARRAELDAAIAPALAEIGVPANQRSAEAVAALERCREAMGRGARVDAFSVGRGAGALKGAACDEYRRAHAAY